MLYFVKSRAFLRLRERDSFMYMQKYTSHRMQQIFPGFSLALLMTPTPRRHG